MLYLDYAKPLTGGKYILNFFAESIEDLDSISHGQRFITKNGIDYGVPQPSSTVVITMPDKTKKTYVLNEAGEWQEGGVDMDYSKLENAPIILANLADKDFIPEANTYYEHLGETTEDFIKGIIYLYDGKGYKAIDGSGGGAGVQPDYNQNDSAAADYIKNRPFYEETKTALTEVFNETLAFEWDETSNAGIYDKEYNGSNPMGEISVGTAMTVIFNGVEYSGTTQDLPDDLKEGLEPAGFTGFIFGASLPASGGDWAPTAEFPFSIVYYGNDDYEGQAVAALSIITSIKQASIPVIIKVKATVTEIHTIDPKFIKDMYYETTNTETLLEQTFTTTTVDNINFWATNTSFINFVKGDTVTINYKGTKYTQEVKELNTVLYVGNLALGGLSPATNEPFLIANIYYPDGLSKLTPGITVATSETQTDANIKIYKSVQDIHTIEPKYIKDMYYSTEAFSPLIDFKVISGDINAIGSTMVVQYNGKEYTETVKDAAEEGSSEHKPYIGFKMEGTVTPTEEQPFCYGINIMFNGNAKELYCAAPKTVSENEVIIYNGESKTVKRLTIEDASILYVGNLHLLSTDFADTGEQYLTLFDYVSLITGGELDLLVSIVPQDGILCGVKSENISYINPKYIKDMYYETRTETELFNGVADITAVESSYYTGTLTPSFTLGESGDKCEVSIDGAVYTLDVIAVDTFSLAGIQDFSNGIPVYIQTSDGVTTIGSETLYNGAVVIKNIHTDIKQIPSKYVPQGGDIVEITITETTDTAIEAALETYLKANTDIAKRLVSSSAFTLKLKDDTGEVSYKFTANASNPVLSTALGSWFTSIAVEDDFWSRNVYLGNRIVWIRSDGSVKYITSVIYDNNLFFGIPDTEGHLGAAEADLAKLGFYRRGEMDLTAESNTIALPEWIKYAQQRADFAIPTPTKDTDLVDKKYVDTAISNAITKTLNTEV